MGLLKKGAAEPLRWDASEKFRKIREYVKEHGITQFLNIYNAQKDREDNVFKWGDELEYVIVNVGKEGTVKLVLKPYEYIETFAAGDHDSDSSQGDEEKSDREENSEEKSDSSEKGGGTTGSSSTSLPSDKPNLRTGFTVLNKDGSPTSKDESPPENDFIVHPEFASYMAELIPQVPHDDTTIGLLNLQKSMATRRTVFEKYLDEGEILLSMPNFPRLGAPGEFTSPPTNPGGETMESAYVSDQVISGHPRFSCLARNIKLRRGKKVDIHVPLFIDKNTVDSSKVGSSLEAPGKTQTFSGKDDDDPPRSGLETSEDLPETMFCTVPAPPDILAIPGNKLGMHDAGVSKTSTIHMDAMSFGMGMCCSQITFLARSMDAGRDMYDQLLVATPVLLALSANTPFYKGLVSDWDVRWNVISMSVDGRTDQERGVMVSKGAPGWGLDERILKSRYSGCSTFLSKKPRNQAKYSDLKLQLNEEVFKTLVDGGVDTVLATHIAHLWIRDPLVIYEDKVVLDDKTSTDHFENIQSTNWGSMRFKIPVPEKGIGWRVEFRPMDLQLTEFENAAYAIFVVLLQRAMIHYDTNLYMPISKIDANMQRAHINNAVRTQQMYFRDTSDLTTASGSDEISEQSIESIVCGPDGKSGLLGLIYNYMSDIECDEDTTAALSRYLDLIKRRATGELLTGAQWQREFVYKHQLYSQDSVLSDALVRELVDEWQRVACHGKQAPNLLPNDFFTCPDTSGIKACQLKV